jgi:hypothetical protein
LKISLKNIREISEPTEKWVLSELRFSGVAAGKWLEAGGNISNVKAQNSKSK